MEWKWRGLVVGKWRALASIPGIVPRPLIPRPRLRHWDGVRLRVVRWRIVVYAVAVAVVSVTLTRIIDDHRRILLHDSCL